MPAPGVTSTTSGTPGPHKSLLNPDECHITSAPITASAYIPAMTAMGKITASGMYIAYDDDGTDDGRRVCQGFNLYEINADDTEFVLGEGNMYIDYADLPTTSGIDANAVTDLAHKVTWKMGVSS
jgi:hypothetical protein